MCRPPSFPSRPMDRALSCPEGAVPRASRIGSRRMTPRPAALTEHPRPRSRTRNGRDARSPRRNGQSRLWTNRKMRQSTPVPIIDSDSDHEPSRGDTRDDVFSREPLEREGCLRTIKLTDADLWRLMKSSCNRFRQRAHYDTARQTQMMAKTLSTLLKHLHEKKFDGSEPTLVSIFWTGTRKHALAFRWPKTTHSCF